MEINFLQFLLIFGVSGFVFYTVFEPFYVYLFKKPLVVHWHLFPNKITKQQKVILNQNFPFYTRLSEKKKSHFEYRLSTFIANYQFIGHDIEITDEILVLVSGTYVMLTFGMRHYLTDLFHKILIYPTAYYSTLNEVYHKGEFNPRMKTVVFSWEDFMLGHGLSTDNINLGLHEFTHVLHFHCLKINDASTTIFQDEYASILTIFKTPSLIQQIQSKAYLRNYAYVNQFEFISVLLEHFFETPVVFKNTHPDLFLHVKRLINHNEWV